VLTRDRGLQIVRSGGAYDSTVRLFSVSAALIGVVLIVMTLARGGGPFSVGVLLGVAFVALGVARYRLQQKLGGRR
jgi:uncharacterized membrane protein